MKKNVIPENDLVQFRASGDRVTSIPGGEWQAIILHLSSRVFEKHDHIVRMGEVMKSFYFICEGLVRLYYSTEDGKEFNKNFIMENGMAGSFQSFSSEAPCGFSIQAMEKTRTIVLPCRVLHEFYERHPCWERLGRKNAEHMLLVKEIREKELLLDSLQTRYRKFLEEFPGLSSRIPQYHIASYLGVTEVALSRLRGRKT